MDCSFNPCANQPDLLIHLIQSVESTVNIKHLSIALALLIACMVGQSQAQDNPVPPPPSPLPVSNSASLSNYYQGPSLRQQQAMYEAEQRMLRMEWNRSIGYSPLRPSVNASYMTYGYQSFYAPQRGIMVNTGHRGWYW